MCRSCVYSIVLPVLVFFVQCVFVAMHIYACAPVTVCPVRLIHKIDPLPVQLMMDKKHSDWHMSDFQLQPAVSK